MQFVHFAVFPVPNIVISVYLLSAVLIKELNWEQKSLSVLLDSVIIWFWVIGIKFDMKLYFVQFNIKTVFQSMSQNYSNVCS